MSRRRAITAAAAAAIAIAAAGGLAAPAGAAWREPFESAAPINSLPTRSASSPSLAAVGGVPAVAWAEDATEPGQGHASQIHVASLAADGRAWRERDGSAAFPISRVGTASSYEPSVADVGGAPWVAWVENLSGPDDVQVRVARPSATHPGWERVVDTDRPINHVRGGPSKAAAPVIAPGPGERPYVALWEFDPGSGSLIEPGYEPGRIWVVRLNAPANDWVAVGGGAVGALSTDSGAPDLAMVGGRPWVSYLQVAEGGTGLQLRVARLGDDGTWKQVGGVIAEGAFDAVGQADITAVDGVPMLAFTDHGRVSVLAADAARTGWRRIGGGFASPAGSDASGPSLADLGGTPWVAWRDGETAHAARLADGRWASSGGPVTGGDAARPGDGPQLAAIGGLPWAAFTLGDGSDPGGADTQPCCDQVRVTRMTPDWSELRTFPAATGASLLVSVQTFGLPFPLGVRYGAASVAAGEAPVAANDSGATLLELRGLMPATAYWLQPYATAGTPVRVEGPLTGFATPPAVDPTPSIAVSVTQPPFVALFVRTHHVRRGQAVRLQLLSSAPGTAALTVRHRGRVVHDETLAVTAGRTRIAWAARRARRGWYRLEVLVRATGGGTAQDAARVRITRARRVGGAQP